MSAISNEKIGTNEMELVDFRIFKLEEGVIDEGIYGINVAKVKEIIRMPELTELPGVPDYVEGVFDLRGMVIPIIDLSRWMGVEVPIDKKVKSRVIIAEFNNVSIGFVVHEAKRIRRISWKDIEPAHFSSSYGNMDRNKITGVTRIEDDRVLLILDLESIVQELGFYQPEMSSDKKRKSFEGTALVLDDSSIARRIVRETLEGMGFRVIEAIDGEVGLQKLEALYETHGERLHEELKIIVSDVEMPQMDGFHFATKAKDDKRFARIPIIFSSSISNKLSAIQGKEVGGEAYVVKFDADVFYEEIERVLEKRVEA